MARLGCTTLPLMRRLCCNVFKLSWRPARAIAYYQAVFDSRREFAVYARTVADTKRFLRDLYDGPFSRHAVSMMPLLPANPLGDFICSTLPVEEWVPFYLRQYEIMVDYRERLDLDFVPFVNLNTNTGIFASAFGCRLHVFKEYDTPACALPAVSTAAAADALADPVLERVPALARILELAERMRERLGPDIPIGVPDVQSPFDISALVWQKDDFFAAMVENPGAVKRLVEKCRRLLVAFLTEFQKRVPNVNLSHCPVTGWAPPELGCWLSEDEAGSISADMFEEFALPSLTDLSTRFGGMFLHCCAAADHQYANFARIPDLRGLNRVFQYPPGPGPALDLFSRQAVMIQAWLNESAVHTFLEQSRPDTRFLFELEPLPIEDAKPVIERVRAACEKACERVRTAS